MGEALKIEEDTRANRNTTRDTVIIPESRSKQANGGERAIGTASTYGQNRTVISGQAKDLHHLRPSDVQVNAARRNPSLTKAAALVPELPETTMTAIPGESQQKHQRRCRQNDFLIWRSAMKGTTVIRILK